MRNGSEGIVLRDAIDHHAFVSVSTVLSIAASESERLGIDYPRG